MTTEKTHWKKLINPDYLGSYSLTPGKDIILTIDKIVREVVKGPGGKKEECTVCYWKEKEKKMILNRENQKRITKIYATPYIEDWSGKKVQIYIETVEAFGDQVEALRIRQFEPKTGKPVLELGTPLYDKAAEHIKGGGTMESIEGKYTMTEEVKTKLKENIKPKEDAQS